MFVFFWWVIYLCAAQKWWMLPRKSFSAKWVIGNKWTIEEGRGEKKSNGCIHYRNVFWCPCNVPRKFPCLRFLQSQNNPETQFTINFACVHWPISLISNYNIHIHTHALAPNSSSWLHVRLNLSPDWSWRIGIDQVSIKTVCYLIISNTVLSDWQSMPRLFPASSLAEWRQRVKRHPQSTDVRSENGSLELFVSLWAEGLRSDTFTVLTYMLVFLRNTDFD